MDQETRQAFEAVDKRLTETKVELLERMEAIETKLLGAFFAWQSAVDQKMHELPIL